MRTEISNPPITGILNEESLKNWNLYGHQEDLFLPVIIDRRIVQFTDTMVKSKSSGDEFYFVKIKEVSSSEEMRYGFFTWSYEPDCDGAYHSFSLINFDQYYYAHLPVEDFKYDKQAIELVDESEILNLLITYNTTRKY
jgi:hypothetical protein